MIKNKLESIDVLNAEQCEEAAKTVLHMHRHFIDRGGFFTLGAACYLDDPRAYAGIANTFNLFLRSQFSPVYTHLFRAMEHHFGVPSGHAEFGMGLPAFHIFGAGANGLEGNIHIDEPYDRVAAMAHLEWSDPFSFTLPIMMPAVGAGVDFWWGMTDEEVGEYVMNDVAPEPLYMPYKLGHLYIHDGMTPHRIANRGEILEGEARITLQGHGVHTAEGTLLYF